MPRANRNAPRPMSRYAQTFVHVTRLVRPAPGTGLTQRVHGAYVADHEVHKVVDYLKTLAIGKEMIPEGDTTPIQLSDYTFSKDEKKLRRALIGSQV